jgi:predicted permease
VDTTALLFALVVTLAVGLFIGVAPILQVLTGREAAAMRESSRGSTEGRRGAAIREALVVSEMAAACVLLVGSGLLMRSFVRVLDVDLGFEPRGAVAWRVDTSRTFDDPQSMASFFANLIQKVQDLPGVESAGLTDSPPLGRNRQWGIRGEGIEYPDNQPRSISIRRVDSGYLQSMRIPLVAGRSFTPFDNHRSDRVLILNQTAALNVFAGQDPIGRTALLGDDEWQVIGIVGDVRHQSLEAGSGNEVYVPYTQVNEGTPVFTMIVRSSLPLAALVPGVQRVLRDADPQMPTGDFQTVSSIVDHAVSPRRFVLTLLGGFAGTALLLAALGIYALLSYSVSQRIPEIGIRMALGESAAQVRWRILSRTMALAIAGVSIGAVLSAVLSGLIQSMLFGVQPADPVTFAAMAAVLLLVAAVAGFLPALRASATDPAVALRT